MVNVDKNVQTSCVSLLKGTRVILFLLLTVVSDRLMIVKSMSQIMSYVLGNVSAQTYNKIHQCKLEIKSNVKYIAVEMYEQVCKYM